MNNTMAFYYNPMSRGRIAHWMLEEVGASYETKILKWETLDQKSPEYLKINPMGKVPSLVHKDVVITENAAICAYLADVFPKSKMAPEINDPQRGSYYRWLFFAASLLEPAMLDKTNPRPGDLKSSQLGHGSYNDVVTTLEKAVAKGYLVGDHFTAADLYMASNLEWFIFTKALEAKPVFTSYIKLCQDRPSHKSFLQKAGSFT